MGTPEGFIMPSSYSAINNGVAKPYMGQAAGTAFWFGTFKQYNPIKSEEAGFEVNDDVECVYFGNDAYCKAVPRRIDRHTFQDHPEILADYQRWKSGAKSDVTDIREWTTISAGEMGMCIACGFHTVEQIFDAPEDRLMALGMNWKDIQNKAKQHINTKRMTKEPEKAKERIIALQEELAEAKKMREEAMRLIAELKGQVVAKPDAEIVLSTEAPKKRVRKAGVQA